MRDSEGKKRGEAGLFIERIGATNRAQICVESTWGDWLGYGRFLEEEVEDMTSAVTS